jgi:hypothetical protein
VRPHPSVAPRHAGATSRDHGSSRSFADVASDSLVPVSCNIQTPTMRLFAVAAACPPEFESYSKRRCSPISFLRKLTVPLPLARKPSNFFFFIFAQTYTIRVSLALTDRTCGSYCRAHTSFANTVQAASVPFAYTSDDDKASVLSSTKDANIRRQHGCTLTRATVTTNNKSRGGSRITNPTGFRRRRSIDTSPRRKKQTPRVDHRARPTARQVVRSRGPDAFFLSRPALFSE